MHNSSIAPRKGSKIKNRLGTNTTATTNTEIVITLEYLKQYFNAFHPLEGTALNIVASLDDPNLNKINLIEGLISQGANKYKALEFALKNNKEQAEYLLNNLTFEPNSSLIQAIQNQSLTLVKYFVEKQEADVNFSNFGFNPLRLAAGLAEPYKTDITCYLLIKGATYLNTTPQEATQAGQNVNDLHKQVFFKAINENNLEVIKKFVDIYGFDVNTEYRFNTPLSTANLKNRKEIAKYLLSKNANSDAALEIAIISGNLNAVKTLLDAGAKINSNKDASPLMLASEHGQVTVVKYLLKHGANYNVKGWEKDNLHSDVSYQLTQITEISKLCKKANFKYILERILKTSIASHYDGYKDLSSEQIKQKFSKFKKQLNQDLQNFTEIKALLDDYSNGKKIPINTHTIVEDEVYVSDFDKAEPKSTKTGSRLEHTPSKSGIFRTFSLKELKELDEETPLTGNIKNLKDIFHSELE